MLPNRHDVLRWIAALAESPTIGEFVDGVLCHLETELDSELVTYNRIDFAKGVAMVAMRPFDEERARSVDGINQKLTEHPVYQWLLARPGHSGLVRLSDAISWDDLVRTPLYREDLAPIGAAFQAFMPMSAFSPVSPDWTFFAISRPSHDYTDTEIDYLALLQLGITAVHTSLTRGPARASQAGAPLTARELAVLQRLAENMTVDRIARTLQMSAGTARKHLEHIHTKLATTDRLSTVLRARELGYLSADEISADFRWDVRLSDAHDSWRTERPT